MLTLEDLIVAIPEEKQSAVKKLRVVPKLKMSRLTMGGSMSARDAKLESMREAVFEDSINYSNKARFGLFSKPFPITSGDTNQSTRASSRKDPVTGEVITALRKI